MTVGRDHSIKPLHRNNADDQYLLAVHGVIQLCELHAQKFLRIQVPPPIHLG